ELEVGKLEAGRSLRPKSSYGKEFMTGASSFSGDGGDLLVTVVRTTSGFSSEKLASKAQGGGINRA
ncbi:hypothetical protein HPP92_026849, partial [Vanilla planifolia]